MILPEGSEGEKEDFGGGLPPGTAVHVWESCTQRQIKEDQAKA